MHFCAAAFTAQEQLLNMTCSKSAKRLLLAIAYALIACPNLSAACNSRAIPKPRPEATTPPPDNVAMTTERPNVTFPIYNCPPTYDAWYCLNEATCFIVEIHNEKLYNCECVVGYMGPRCEYKEVDGSYLPTRNRVMLEKASIVSGATLALLFMAMSCIICYLRHEKKLKQKLHESGSDVGDMACENAGMDVVDAMTPLPIRRPFGTHHSRILSLEQAFQAALVAKQPLR